VAGAWTGVFRGSAAHLQLSIFANKHEVLACARRKAKIPPHAVFAGRNLVKSEECAVDDESSPSLAHGCMVQRKILYVRI
jgi:hypothetical protein